MGLRGFVERAILAEFDSDLGSRLVATWSQEHGSGNDWMLRNAHVAEMMLPEQAHMRDRDRYVVIPNAPNERAQGSMTYLFNVVHVQRNAHAKRGGHIRAIALASKDLAITYFEPLLLSALEHVENQADYVLQQLVTTINRLDIPGPALKPAERYVLRALQAEEMYEALWRKASPPIEFLQGYYAIEFPMLDDGDQAFRGFAAEFGTCFMSGAGSIKADELHMPWELFPHGRNTPSLFVIIHAILLQRRVMFLGAKQSARRISSHVMTAVQILSNATGLANAYTSRAFPYANLKHVDMLLSTPGYIAGVSNPVFERHPDWWDVLCDMDTGCVIISPTYAARVPETPASSFPSLTRDHTLGHRIAQYVSEPNSANLVWCALQSYVTDLLAIGGDFEESHTGKRRLPAQWFSIGYGKDGASLLPAETSARHAFYTQFHSTTDYENLKQIKTVASGISPHDLRPFLQSVVWGLTPAISFREFYEHMKQKITLYTSCIDALVIIQTLDRGWTALAAGLFHEEQDIRELCRDVFHMVAVHVSTLLGSWTHKERVLKLLLNSFEYQALECDV